MSEIKVVYNPDNEMMEIKINQKVVFIGNYWDFNRDPKSLADFLSKLELNVDLEESKENLP